MHASLSILFNMFQFLVSRTIFFSLLISVHITFSVTISRKSIELTCIWEFSKLDFKGTDFISFLFFLSSYTESFFVDLYPLTIKFMHSKRIMHRADVHSWNLFETRYSRRTRISGFENKRILRSWIISACREIENIEGTARRIRDIIEWPGHWASSMHFSHRVRVQ